MKFLHASLVTLALSLSETAAADCKDVIELSKIRSEIVQDSSSLDTLARNFCKEYASAKSSNKSMNIGVSYASLGATFGQGSASSEQIASRYCDSTDSSKSRSDAYRQYVESIAPGAFSAYERCEALRGSGINISVDKNAVLPKFFVASVSFQSTDARALQVIDYAASPEVRCTWKNGDKQNTQTTLLANTSDALTCQRDSDAAKSTVQIFPKTKPNAQLSFPWDAYQSGVPVDFLKQLSMSLEASVTALNGATNSLRSGVLAFALASCPSGWEEYAPAAGRFVRGVDRSGAVDPDGVRTPGSLQADQFAGTYSRGRHPPERRDAQT